MPVHTEKPDSGGVNTVNRGDVPRAPVSSRCRVGFRQRHLQRLPKSLNRRAGPVRGASKRSARTASRVTRTRGMWPLPDAFGGESGVPGDGLVSEFRRLAHRDAPTGVAARDVKPTGAPRQFAGAKRQIVPQSGTAKRPPAPDSYGPSACEATAALVAFTLDWYTIYR